MWADEWDVWEWRILPTDGPTALLCWDRGRVWLGISRAGKGCTEGTAALSGVTTGRTPLPVVLVVEGGRGGQHRDVLADGIAAGGKSSATTPGCKTGGCHLVRQRSSYGRSCSKHNPGTFGLVTSPACAESTLDLCREVESPGDSTIAITW